jgi:hypothetical protein
LAFSGFALVVFVWTNIFLACTFSPNKLKQGNGEIPFYTDSQNKIWAENPLPQRKSAFSGFALAVFVWIFVFGPS